MQPLPTEVNPRVAFERLFGDGTSPEERRSGRKQNASILDSVTQEIAFFKKPLGAGDKARLDTYLENIREIERRIKIAMEKTVQEPSEEIPFGLPENKHVHYRLMYDLLALAFEGDLTRSATFMLGKDLSGASFPESGFNGGWHGSSHHGDKPDNVANYAKMNRYHVQNLAYFADKLSKIPDGDGTLLDHILIYKGSNMGNSHRHAHVKVPIILLGGLDGNFKGNRHIVFPDNTERTSNMLLSAAPQVRHRRDSEIRCGRTQTGTNRELRLQHEADFPIAHDAIVVSIAIAGSLALGRAGRMAGDSPEGCSGPTDRCGRSFARTARRATASTIMPSTRWIRTAGRSLSRTNISRATATLSDSDRNLSAGLAGVEIRSGHQAVSREPTFRRKSPPSFPIPRPIG